MHWRVAFSFIMCNVFERNCVWCNLTWQCGIWLEPKKKNLKNLSH